MNFVLFLLFFLWQQNIFIFAPISSLRFSVPHRRGKTCLEKTKVLPGLVILQVLIALQTQGQESASVYFGMWGERKIIIVFRPDVSV